MTAPISFGPYVLYPAEHRLEKSGRQIRLGARACDILLALIERPGDVVDQRTLLERVWPKMSVEASNLRVHIRALRKALDDEEGEARYIINVPGRGYRFAYPVTSTSAESAAAATAALHPLPRSLERMVGRSQAVAAISTLLRASRFTTIVAGGGMGKTTVALAVAHRMLPRFEGAVCFVSVSDVTEEAMIPHAVSSALGLQVHNPDPIPAILTALGARSTLIVLDGCETVINSVAALAERIFLETNATFVLATSREPLRVEGEHVYPLEPLETPPEDSAVDEILAYAGPGLFIERAEAAGASIKSTDSDLRIIADMCRRLDGMPLAIEFAAAQTPILGIEGVASRLDDRFQLLNQGRRTAPPRHQTLSAVLDWSYALLSEGERDLLDRLSLFVGSFSAEAAIAVDGREDPAQTTTDLHGLVSKSLVVVDSERSLPYRLLDTTAAYSRSKLRARSDARQAAYRHAAYFSDLLDQAWSDKARTFDEGGYAALQGHLGNVRSALRWAFSREGDLSLAIPLAASASIYLDELNLAAEGAEWAARALAIMGPELRDTRHELTLQFALAQGLVVSRGNADEARRAIVRTIELATALNDLDLQMRVFGGYHIYLGRMAQFKQAMELALRAERVAKQSGDAMALAMADAMLCHSYHYAGDQAKAETHKQAVHHRAPPHQRVNTIRFGIDQRVRTLSVSARILWLLGRPAEAMAETRALMDFSESQDNPVVLVMGCHAAAMVRIWCGAWDSAEQVINLMSATGEKHSIHHYAELSAAFMAELRFRAGQASANLEEHHAAFEKVRISKFNLAYLGSGLAEALRRAERLDDANALIDLEIKDMDASGQGLFMPEYIRALGDIHADRGEREESQSCYRRAIELARAQSALAWELRATMSSACLVRDQANRRSLLEPILERFTDGYSTPDLDQAKALYEGQISTG